ncbi:hypothetical protein BH10ACI2_BH10ACI2_10530 [soil metagenome]
MKKFFAGFVVLACALIFASVSFRNTVEAYSPQQHSSAAASSTLVLSQVGQGGGGSTGTYIFDYVEIKNISGSSQSLNGLALYYGAATGNFASTATNSFALPNVSLSPGQYYLVQLGASGTAGANLPVSPDATTTGLSMQGASGKVALVNASALAINACGAAATPCSAAQLAQMIDWVAYGAAGNGTVGIGEGGTSVNNGVGLATTQGSVRKGLGCTDTDNNNNDLDVITNPVPRNTATAVSPCAVVPTPTPTPTPSGTATPTPTPTPIPSPTPTPGPVATTIVISQFQTAGGASEDEFIELHNAGTDPIDLNGYRLVYRSATGTNDVGPFATWTTSTVLQSGQFYMIASTGYDGGVTPDLKYNPATCQCSMSASGGGLALRPTVGGTPVDMVGWGTATNAFIETAVTTAPPLNDSRSRGNTGCRDTNNNANDFTATSPAAARNKASAPYICGVGGGVNLFAFIGASPAIVAPAGTTLFTVSVTPATTPPSTGVTVTGNLSAIGGIAAQTFFDNGLNGDLTAGDNVYSFLATVPLGAIGGTRNVTAVATDAQGRTVNLSQNITVNAPLPNEDPLIFGNPSKATADVANENNYLMQKPQYTLSYNRSKATPNWTAWRLDSSWIGTAARQDDFRPDTTLPTGWYQVLPEDYAEPLYDRGHMCPSGDRTNSIANNSATFLMTNMVPQHPDNNQGPWEDFESYLRTVAGQGNEIYIISGPVGNIGTIGATAENRIVIPSATWKVVLVLPNGSNDLQRVTRATRAFGIVIPNNAINRNGVWREYRTTVNQVEILTGYDFFSLIPKNTQEIIEGRRDHQ